MLRRGLGQSLRTHSPLGWHYHDDRHMLTSQTANQVGQMLLDENVKSVSYRYDDSGITDLPGRLNAEWLIPFKYKSSPFAKTPKAVECLKLISCYEYQSCEHPDWHESEAHAFCQALRHAAIESLPGYDDAPWEWTEKNEKLQPAVTSPSYEGNWKHETT